MDKINLLLDYPIDINRNSFGITDPAVENELFNAVWIQRAEPTYNVEAVTILSKMWKCPVNYLLGRLRCEAAHRLVLIEKNMAEGLYYYKLAAEENQSVEALYSLSNLKLKLLQSLPAYEESLAHLKQASDCPHNIVYEVDEKVRVVKEGQPEDKEDPEMEEKIEKKVYKITNKFIIESQLMYANLRFEGMGGTKDLKEAKKYYDLALGASLIKGPPFAKYAIILCRGDGGDEIPKDLEKGLEILKGIIDNGGDNVQPGITFSYGNFLFENDPNLAINYIRLAAKQGYPVAKEQLNDFEKKLLIFNKNNPNAIQNNENNNKNKQTTNNQNSNNNNKKKTKPVKKNNLC